jgi:hypothetical protein
MDFLYSFYTPTKFISVSLWLTDAMVRGVPRTTDDYWPNKLIIAS